MATEQFGMPAWSMDIEQERDPQRLIAGAKDVLDGQGRALEAALPWDGYQLAAAQRRLIILERITKRLRIVMAMQRGPAEDQDWQGVEERVGESQRRERTVQGGIPE